ncbi:MAG: dipeptidase [Chitinophagales bacterium]|nr:dipeptidase [Chitinophagales bacterium]
MRHLFFLLALFTTTLLAAQSVKKIHSKAVLVDTHNDVLSSGVLDGIDISKRVKEGHSDLDRWKEGGVDVQFFSVWTGDKPRNKEGFFQDAKQEIDSLNILVLKNPFQMTLARNYKEVKKGIRQGKLVALIGVEGGHMIEDNLGKLEELYKQDTRYMTLTWNNSTSWATSAMDETLHADSLKHKGLTDFGKHVVKKMNELGMIVDLSHTGEQTFYDALAVTSKPVLLSHSSVWSICPVFRNVKDDQIKAVAKNGGVICINFYSGFISKEYDQRSTYLNGPGKKIIQDSLFSILHDSAAMKTQWQQYYDAEMNKVRPSIGQLVDHIDHIVKLVGDDYVGIGSDYDGVGSLPVGLEDVTTYPRITEELYRRGYSKKSISKILGDNVLRVMKANFK